MPDPVAPRYATDRDPAYRTMGRKVAKVARGMGYQPMPWQDELLDTALEVDDDGLYRYGLVVVSVQRQAGKSAIMQPVAAHRAMTRPRGRIWSTAQRRQDARDLWMETADRVEGSVFADRVKRRDSNGQEQLLFPGRATIRPFNATDEKVLHGRQSDLIAVDEAWAFTAEQGTHLIQGAQPTMATRPGAQMWVYSAAGTPASTWLWPMIQRGRASVADPGARMAFFEYGIPEDTEDLEDLDVYIRHHPAVGHTIAEKAIRDAWEQMGSPSQFARAYGNFWTGSSEHAIDPKLWERARTTDKIAPGSRVAFAAEVSADRAGGVICCAGYTADGRVAVEVVDARTGIGWIAERLAELSAKHRPVSVMVDPTSPAGIVHRVLQEKHRRRVPLPDDFSAGVLVDSQTELLDGLVAQTLRHRDDERLDAAVAVVTVRTLRETTVFSRLVSPDGTSPAALIAAMLAAYGLRHPVRPGGPLGVSA